jgi:hypothetical protein
MKCHEQKGQAMSVSTFVFGQVADKLLDAFLPYCILEISRRRRYLLRSHLAIMIPVK